METSPTQCQRTYSIFSLFTSGTWLALVSLNIAFQFIVIVMVYYGLSFAAGSLPGSIYINNVISGVVELVAYILTYFTLDKLGRKKLTAGPLILAGFSMILGEYYSHDFSLTSKSFKNYFRNVLDRVCQRSGL